jgi:hypothetical protein
MKILMLALKSFTPTEPTFATVSRFWPFGSICGISEKSPATLPIPRLVSREHGKDEQFVILKILLLHS